MLCKYVCISSEIDECSLKECWISGSHDPFTTFMNIFRGKILNGSFAHWEFGFLFRHKNLFAVAVIQMFVGHNKSVLSWVGTPGAESTANVPHNLLLLLQVRELLRNLLTAKWPPSLSTAPTTLFNFVNGILSNVFLV